MASVKIEHCQAGSKIGTLKEGLVEIQFGETNLFLEDVIKLIMERIEFKEAVKILDILDEYGILCSGVTHDLLLGSHFLHLFKFGFKISHDHRSLLWRNGVEIKGK